MTTQTIPCQICDTQSPYLIAANFISDDLKEDGKKMKQVCIKCYRTAEREALQAEKELNLLRLKLKSEGKL